MVAPPHARPNRATSSDAMMPTTSTPSVSIADPYSGRRM